MELHQLEAPIPNRKSRKRVGRGEGSGLGKQSGKGHKGQKSRGSGKVARGFEGGQMPLQRRIPKFGFKNPFRTEYVALNLNQVADAITRGKLKNKITFADLQTANLVDKNDLVKLLGNGELTVAVEIEVHACSKSAKEKIEKAGGSVVLLAAPAVEEEKPAKKAKAAPAETTEPVAEAPAVEAEPVAESEASAVEEPVTEEPAAEASSEEEKSAE